MATVLTDWRATGLQVAFTRHNSREAFSPLRLVGDRPDLDRVQGNE